MVIEMVKDARYSKLEICAMSTKDSGKMTITTDKAFTHGQMAVCIQELGRKVNEMEKELRHGQMEGNMRGLGKTIRSMDKEFL